MFRKRYGNLLGLLEVEVQKFIITTLVQYYDPLLRCFTFQDFQLVPTIEECEHIVDMPLEGKVSYQYLEQYTSISTLAGIMRMHPKELKDRLVSRKGSKGFPQRFLEAYLHQLSNREDWETFMDVLTLAIYGVLLFPNIEDFVDYSALMCLLLLRLDLKIRSCRSWHTLIRHLICAMREKRGNFHVVFLSFIFGYLLVSKNR